ncbi:MAG: ANTAR domain-containing protein [Oscillospiraceae bacterium]|nr:ANTAR domain-containing protein [Oscillospiraceae bacterium]
MPLPRFLLVSGSQKGGQYFSEVLSVQEGDAVLCCDSAAQARKKVQAGEAFDCCILNAPLADEDGSALAAFLAQKTQAQILFLSPESITAQQRCALKAQGVMVLLKPVGRQVLHSALEQMQTVQIRLAQLQNQNQRLTQQIGELQLIHRAKCVLIASLGMSEIQAHKHMERQAMNQRITRIEVARNVLQLYDNS